MRTLNDKDASKLKPVQTVVPTRHLGSVTGIQYAKVYKHMHIHAATSGGGLFYIDN